MPYHLKVVSEEVAKLVASPNRVRGYSMESSKWSILSQLEGDLISAGGAQGRRRSSRLGRRRVAKLSRAHSIFKVSKFLKVKVF